MKNKDQLIPLTLFIAGFFVVRAVLNWEVIPSLLLFLLCMQLVFTLRAQLWLYTTLGITSASIICFLLSLHAASEQLILAASFTACLTAFTWATNHETPQNS